MFFLLLIGNVAEFNNLQRMSAPLDPIRRPDRNRNGLPVLPLNVKTGMCRRQPGLLFEFSRHLLAFAQRMQHGDVHPNQLVAAIPHQRFRRGVRIHHQPCIRVDRELPVLCITPAQGIKALSILG